MMNTVQQMSSFEFQMVCAVRLILASCLWPVPSALSAPTA